MLLPLMAEIVRRSACRGSKSVEAMTISSPTFQPLAFSTWIDVAPALAVADSLLHVLVVEPCRFSVPPDSMMPRSPMPAITSSPLTLSVRVMVALWVWGLAWVPMANSPWSTIHSVVSSRSVLSEKLSLPSMERPLSAGGLTSSTTSLSLPMMTLSPATGTLLFGQVAGSDQFVGLADPARVSREMHPRRHEGCEPCKDDVLHRRLLPGLAQQSVRRRPAIRPPSAHRPDAPRGVQREVAGGSPRGVVRRSAATHPRR